jgi:predicted NAD/FAD-binding protein
MSLSIRVDEKNLEWAGQNLNAVFGQRKNLFRPSFYAMLLEILRFHREVEDNRNLSLRHAWTLGELLIARRFTDSFRNDYLLPMSAAIWSTPEKGMLDFPAAPFLTFLINHKLVQVEDRPVWRTVKGGSIQYVQKVAKHIPHVHLASPVLEVRREGGRVKLKTAAGEGFFDQVIFATHAPITARILVGQTQQEAQILGAFRTEANHAVLHQDPQLLPINKRCWASWNVRGEQGSDKVTLSYHLNRLQPLATKSDYFLTLNPKQSVQKASWEMDYDHPRFDQAAIRAQRDLATIQGGGGVYYAGAWTRYGFHEDGLLSAVRVAEMLGQHVPWSTS